MKTEKITIGNIPVLLYGTNSDKLYIFVHGRYGKKEEANDFAAAVVKFGFQVISFDLPEHGERKDEEYGCTVENGIHDLKEVYSYVENKYKSFSLYAGSLGAYFSLSAYQNVMFEKCLFLSPVLDMERLIQNMMKKANVTEEALKQKGKIETSFGEILSWDYYDFVRNNPIKKWDSKTFILYGENDDITERDILDSFAKKFKCNVDVMRNGEHWFHTAEQVDYVGKWIQSIIENQGGL